MSTRKNRANSLIFASPTICQKNKGNQNGYQQNKTTGIQTSKTHR